MVLFYFWKVEWQFVATKPSKSDAHVVHVSNSETEEQDSTGCIAPTYPAHSSLHVASKYHEHATSSIDHSNDACGVEDQNISVLKMGTHEAIALLGLCFFFNLWPNQEYEVQQALCFEKKKIQVSFC